MRKLILIGFLQLLFFATLPAQDYLTLEEALNLGRKQNLNLRQQEQAVRQAIAERQVQRSAYFPSVILGGGYNYISEIARLDLPFQLPGQKQVQIEAGVRDQFDLNIAVRQPLFTGFRTRNLVKAAEAAVNVNQYQLQAEENRLLLQITSQYYRGQLNELQQKALEASLERAVLQLKTVKNLFREGQATRQDTMQIATRLLEVQTRLAKLRHTGRLIRLKLADLLQLDEVPQLPPFQQTGLDIQLINGEENMEIALQLRPEIYLLQQRASSEDFRKKATRSVYLPQIFASASYHYSKPGVDFFRNEWMQYYTIGLQLNWELWQGGKTRARVSKISHGLEILSLEEQKLRDAIRLEVRSVHEDLVSDREQILLSQKLLDQERERYRVVREKYTQGQVAVTDLTSAETDLTTAQLNYQQNLITWKMDKARLRFATGEMGASEEK